jgi:hypothetical protein
MTPSEYREKADKLLAGLKDPVIAFVEYRCYQEHHSYGYEEILNAIPELRQEIIQLFADLGIEETLWK